MGLSVLISRIQSLTVLQTRTKNPMVLVACEPFCCKILESGIDGAGLRSCLSCHRRRVESKACLRVRPARAPPFIFLLFACCLLQYCLVLPAVYCKHYHPPTTSMPAEKVIELSVEETNQLRAELGLAPLRDGTTTTAATPAAADGDGEKKELLELSVQDTNDLRARLGLKPLTTAASSAATSASKIQHAPAVNLGDTKAAAERIEQAKLKRQVEQKLQENFATQSLGEQQPEGSSAASWAQQMRKAEKQSSKTAKAAKTKGKPQEYGERDLQGLSVGHALTELEAGSETVLTLQDAPLLQTDKTSQKVLGLHEGGQEELQNVDLAAAPAAAARLGREAQGGTRTGPRGRVRRL